MQTSSSCTVKPSRHGRHFVSAVFAAIVMVVPAAHPADAKGGAVATDPNLSLEEGEGDRAIAWARAQNERTLTELQADPRYPRFEAEARRILEARARMPDPRVV